MLCLSLNQDVAPLLPRPLTETEAPQAQAWLNAMTVYLNSRYGNKINPDNSPAFAYYVAESITRRLAKPNSQATSETLADMSVSWSANSARGGFFLASEISEMDQITQRYTYGVIRHVSNPYLDRVNRTPTDTYLL